MTSSASQVTVSSNLEVATTSCPPSKLQPESSLVGYSRNCRCARDWVRLAPHHDLRHRLALHQTHTSSRLLHALCFALWLMSWLKVSFSTFPSKKYLQMQNSGATRRRRLRSKQRHRRRSAAVHSEQGSRALAFSPRLETDVRVSLDTCVC